MHPRDVIDALCDDPARTGLVLDFDGTLAPIVDDPETSAPLPGVVDLLAQLADRLAVVALLSGRPAAFLADRVPAPGVVLLGAYGAEVVRDGTVHTSDAVAPWLPVVRTVLTELDEPPAGVVVEDKGLALGLHWRRAVDPDAAARWVTAVADDVAARTGLHREPGKLVVELRPPGMDKGAALDRLLDDHRVRTVAYAGDDLGDVSAFAVVARRGGTRLVVRTAETAPEVIAAADVIFDGVPALTEWLHSLSAHLR